jgi:hypothetical protein
MLVHTMKQELRDASVVPAEDWPGRTIEEVEAEAVPAPDDNDSSVRLVREAIDEARALVQLELALAREELQEELARAKGAVAAMGAAAALAVAGFAMLVDTIALASGKPWLAALLLGAGLLVVALGLGALGWRTIPHDPMHTTRARLESSVREFKERTA